MKKESTLKTISVPKILTDESGEIRPLTEEDFKWAVSKKQLDSARKQTTIRLKQSTILYFQALSNQVGIPYQTLINLFLDNCAKEKLVPEIVWESAQNKSGV